MRSLVPTFAVITVLSLACTSRQERPPAEVQARGVPEGQAVAVVPREPVTLEIRATVPGYSVIQVEREIVVPLEQALADIPALAGIHSRSAPDRATIMLTFEASADAERSLILVHERLGSMNRSLPEDVIPVLGFGLARASERVFTLSSITHNGMDLHRVAVQVRESLLAVPGVGQVELCGGREPRLVVSVDPARLTALNVPIGTIITALRTNLGDAPGLPSRLAGPAMHDMAMHDMAMHDMMMHDLMMHDMDELMALIVAPGAQPLALRDLASASVEPRVPKCDAARIGGAPVVVGVVRPRRGADLAAIDTGIREQLVAQKSELPPDFVLELPDAPPIRFALELTATADPSATLMHAGQAFAGALGGRPAVLKVTTPLQGGMRVDGELLVANMGVGAADLAMLERALASLPGIRVRAQGVADSVNQIDDPSLLRFRIMGDELEVDLRLAREAAELVAVVPGVLGAEARDESQPSVNLTIKPVMLADLGLPGDAVRDVLAAALEGVPVGSLQLHGSRMPVLVRLGSSGDHLAQMAALPKLEIIRPGGGTVRLDQLVHVSHELEPGTITRIDGHRAVVVEVRVREDPAKVYLALQRALETSLQLPPGYVVIWDPSRG